MGDVLLDEEMVRPAAAEVVRTLAFVVGVTALFGSTDGGFLNPVLNGALRHVNERLVPGDLLGLDVAVGGRLNVDGDPRLALLTVDELAGRAFPADDFELVVPAVGHPRDVLRLDVEDLADPEPAVADQLNRDLVLEGVGSSG